jgi:hypothetical protein
MLPWDFRLFGVLRSACRGHVATPIFPSLISPSYAPSLRVLMPLVCLFSALLVFALRCWAVWWCQSQA